MKLIDLNGNTWDGTKLSSKYKPVYDAQGRNEMMGVTLGWLIEAPEFDLEKHYAEIRAKAIEEFAERLLLEISESIVWGMLVNSDKDNSFSDTSDKIVDYVVDTAKKIADRLKGGAT